MVHVTYGRYGKKKGVNIERQTLISLLSGELALFTALFHLP